MMNSSQDTAGRQTSSLRHRSGRLQPVLCTWLATGAATGGLCAALLISTISATSRADTAAPAVPPMVKVPQAEAATPAEMKPYTEQITGTKVTLDMVPIPGGEFVMGSPEEEDGRKADEGPQHRVKIEPFWMGKYEVTWDQYDIWSFRLDIQRRRLKKIEPTDREKLADAVTRPTAPYTDMTFDMGHDGYPAISMTQLAAKMYCEWLSEKTGRYYRLPTEAEWEYACRAGTTTTWSFGNDPEQLGEYAWYFANSGEKYQKVGQKKPNPWGLHDMHGNVAEWVLDQYLEDFYGTLPQDSPAEFPLAVPTKLYPRVVRGGSWDDEPDRLRSAARRASSLNWKIQDPQIPQSIWYHTDAQFLGFRVVRPLKTPDLATRAKLRLAPIPDDLIKR